MDKIKKLRERQPAQRGNFNRGIYFNFEDNDNIVRLVGEFLEIKTHFLKPNAHSGEKGLCRKEAFDKGKDNSLPPLINCPDWDVDAEEAASTKTCVICRLNRIAREVMKNGNPTEEEKEWLQKISQASNARTSLKWNVIDRRDPYVIEDTNNGERKVLGLKVATLGMEAWRDVEGIFMQIGGDITDAETGIDINIVKGNNGHRTTYSAKAVLDGMNVRQTPLTEEELALDLHDLKRIYGRSIEPERVMEGLHEDYADMIRADEIPDDDAEEEFPEGDGFPDDDKKK
jgi:hypothetical protein